MRGIIYSDKYRYSEPRVNEIIWSAGRTNTFLFNLHNSVNAGKDVGQEIMQSSRGHQYNKFDECRMQMIPDPACCQVPELVRVKTRLVNRDPNYKPKKKKCVLCKFNKLAVRYKKLIITEKTVLKTITKQAIKLTEGIVKPKLTPTPTPTPIELEYTKHYPEVNDNRTVQYYLQKRYRGFIINIFSSTDGYWKYSIINYGNFYKICNDVNLILHSNLLFQRTGLTRLEQIKLDNVLSKFFSTHLHCINLIDFIHQYGIEEVYEFIKVGCYEKSHIEEVKRIRSIQNAAKNI